MLSLTKETGAVEPVIHPKAALNAFSMTQKHAMNVMKPCRNSNQKMKNVSFFAFLSEILRDGARDGFDTIKRIENVTIQLQFLIKMWFPFFF